MDFVYNENEKKNLEELREENVKFELDKQYLKVSIYGLGTLAAGYIIYSILKNSGKLLGLLLSGLGEVFGVLSPLIIGLVLMYLLYPAVLKVEQLLKKSISYFNLPKKAKQARNLSVLIVYAVVVLALVALVFAAYRLIAGNGGSSGTTDLSTMIDTISSYASTYNQVFNDFSVKLNELGLSDQFKQQSQTILETAKKLITGAVSGFFGSIGNIGGNIISFILGILISFYLISDLTYFSNLMRTVLRVFSKKRLSNHTKSVIDKLNRVISGFIRGQLLDALIVGILNSIGMVAIGLDFAIVIGMMAGACNIIPYFGMYIAMVPAIIVGLLSGVPIKALFAALVMIAVQQIDTIFISPRVIGGNVGLHPVFVILSITIAGSFFGLFGMLVAVPVAAMIKVLFVEYVLENPKSIERDGFE